MGVVVNITNLKLTDYQKKILDCPSRFTVTEAGTKVGKTESHIFWLFKQAHQYKVGAGHNYWWVAPVYTQAKIAYNRMWQLVAHTGVYKTNKTDLTITTPYKTIIHFKSAKDPNNLYGEDVYSAVFDEFTRATPESWYALRSTLTHTQAPCKLIGNYKGNSNWGHQLALKSSTDSNYAYFKITAWDAVRAGILKEEEVLQAQKDMPLFMFKALYLAEGDIDKARLIEDTAINNLELNINVSVKGAYITADIATYGADRCVIFVWNGFKIVDYFINEITPPDIIEKKIRDFAVQYSVPLSKIVYDADGAGIFLRGYLAGANPFYNNSSPINEKGQKVQYINLKSQCYFKMAERINEGKYLIGCNLSKYKEDLFEELEMVKNRNIDTDNKLAVLKKEEIKEYIGRSPDLTDAFAMREFFELKKTSFVSS